MKKDAAFHSFQEYLTAKDKVVTKPPVEEVPDYKGPKAKTPPAAATKGKGWSVPKNGKRGTTQPYAAPGKGGGLTKKEKGGFGELGNKDLVYQPAGKGVAGNNKKWPDGNTTTEAFLAKTKDMNTSQFAKHVKKSMTEHCGCEDKKAPHVVAYSVGAYHPDPIQAIKYVAYLANENANLRRALIREANRAGCSAELLYELLQIPESFMTLAHIIDGEKGASFTRKLEKAIRENRDAYRKKAKLHEEVDEPAHDDDIDVDNTDKDLSLDDEDDDDLDLDGDSDDDGDLDLDGGDDDDLDLGDGPPDGAEGDDAPPPPPDEAEGDLGDAPPDEAGGDLGSDLGDAPPDEAGGDEPPPPPDDGEGDDDAKIDFDDDDDLDDDHDDEDLDDDLDDDHDDDEHDDDDLDDDNGKKKMPWED